MAILFCMLVLAVFCVAEGSLGFKLDFYGLDFVPLVAFVSVAFFYVAGISRNILLIMQQILTSYSLQLHLRTLSIAVTWFFIFAMTKLLPQLLYLVGVGYFYCLMVFLTLLALIFLSRIIPTSLNLEVDRATPNQMQSSLVASSTSSGIVANEPLSWSSENEVQVVEEVWRCRLFKRLLSKTENNEFRKKLFKSFCLPFKNKHVVWGWWLGHKL